MARQPGVDPAPGRRLVPVQQRLPGPRRGSGSQPCAHSHGHAPTHLDPQTLHHTRSTPHATAHHHTLANPLSRPQPDTLGYSPGNVREIGRSVEDRPLEIIRFGNGPVVKLIVAGTHGGYEHNTIELADEMDEKEE